MSEVSLHIGGRTYRVACAPGEEDRVARLGDTIADKLASIGNPAGPDAQNLLFAALLLADEVHESRETASAPERTAPADEASTAADAVEPLKSRIVDLETEVARMEDAARDSREEIEAARARENELSRQLAGYEDEKERLRTRLAEVERAAASIPVSQGVSGAGDLSALAPALERFAEMLEECADKLESRAAAS